MNFQEVQIDFAYKIKQILDFSFTCGYGDHPVAYLKGIVAEEERQTFLQRIDGDTPLAVKNVNGKSIFYGYVSEVRFEQVGGLYYLHLTARGATAKLDILKRSRTFFKKGITYQEIVDSVLDAYPGAYLLSHVDFAKQTDFPIIQYQETDWEFLTRIASLFGASLRSMETSDLPRIEVGYEKGKVRASLKVDDVETQRDLLTCEKEFYGRSEVFSVVDANRTETEEKLSELINIEYPDALNYTWKAFTLEEYYPIGTLLRINGAELVVSYVEGYLEKGELSYDYVVRLPESVRVTYQDNEKLPGGKSGGNGKGA